MLMSQSSHLFLFPKGCQKFLLGILRSWLAPTGLELNVLTQDFSLVVMLQRTGKEYIWQFYWYHSFLKNDHLLWLVSSIKIFNIVTNQDLRLEIASIYEIVNLVTEFRWYSHILKCMAGKFWLHLMRKRASKLWPGSSPTASAVHVMFPLTSLALSNKLKEYSSFRSFILGKNFECEYIFLRNYTR